MTSCVVKHEESCGISLGPGLEDVDCTVNLLQKIGTCEISIAIFAGLEE